MDRYRLWWYMLIVFLSVNTSIRIVLFFLSFSVLSLTPFDLVRTFASGLIYDIIAGLYFSLFLFLLIWALPQRFLLTKKGIAFQKILFGIHFLVLIVNAIAELFFWNEFSGRYNFIAVDYLIYTNEVLKNILQSYSIPLLISAIVIPGSIIWAVVRKNIFTGSSPVALKYRMLALIAVPAILVSDFFWAGDGLREVSSNKMNKELAGNGMYQFASAFRKNEMPYTDFYLKENEDSVFTRLRTLLREPGTEYISPDIHHLERKISPEGAPRKLNVVMITIESLSAEYLSYFKDYHQYYYPDYLMKQIGIAPNLTPNLDSLVKESLFFTQLYASGTRTVRGLEAVSTSLPPTPGQSVVKRLPTRQGIFTLGKALKDQGYDSRYIYGGNSYFDNMGDFFGKNGYTVVDERDIPGDSIHHETAWGVCDEDLYAEGLREMDKSYAAGKLFFHHLMTVSNHRPYTYPEGRVSIPPSIKRREGGLIYTDYAIAKFLREARMKPWFKNTIFVILADHCASVGGRTDMPINKYHIPCWIYAPGLIKPGRFERLTSQLDIPPTIMGLLNLPYESSFFGYDIFRLEPGRERILMVNYQDIALVKDGKMVVLSPQKKAKMYLPDFRTGAMQEVTMDEHLKQEAIAWFQGASAFLEQGKHHN